MYAKLSQISLKSGLCLAVYEHLKLNYITIEND